MSLMAEEIEIRPIREVIVDFRSMSRAASDGDIESVKILLNRNVPPDGISPDDIKTLDSYPKLNTLDEELLYYTDTYVRPIQAASEKGHFEIVKLLLKKWC